MGAPPCGLPAEAAARPTVVGDLWPVVAVPAAAAVVLAQASRPAEPEPSDPVDPATGAAGEPNPPETTAETAPDPGTVEVPAGPRLSPDDEDNGLSFRQIIEKHEKKIYNLILRQIGDREEAEDLTQETFVNAYRSFPAFRGDCKVHTWLCQIALNQCKNRFRQRDRRRVVEGPSLDAPAGADESLRPLEIPDWDQSPQDVLFRNEMYRYVLKAIDSLPDEYRQVIKLCDLHHLSYMQIAEITELSLEAVKTRIHRGRLMLRRKLEAYLKS